MKIKTWNIILLGGILFTGGIGLGFLMNDLLIPQILVVLGIGIVLFESVRKYIFKKASLKTIGIGVLIFSIFNFLRHSMFFILISRISELFENDPWLIWFLVREVIWLIMSVWVLFHGVHLLREHKELNFEEYVQSKEFKMLYSVFIILLILEIPIFGIHGGFGGGLHGHGFWDGGTHLH